jgi:hypothetical protein
VSNYFDRRVRRLSLFLAAGLALLIGATLWIEVLARDASAADSARKVVAESLMLPQYLEQERLALLQAADDAILVPTARQTIERMEKERHQRLFFCAEHTDGQLRATMMGEAAKTGDAWHAAALSLLDSIESERSTWLVDGQASKADDAYYHSFAASLHAAALCNRDAVDAQTRFNWELSASVGVGIALVALALTVVAGRYRKRRTHVISAVARNASTDKQAWTA